MANRILTAEQFADGLVLDSEKVDQALTDTFEKLNNLDIDIDVSSMVQKQFIWGASPPVWNWENSSPVTLPWLPTPGIYMDSGSHSFKQRTKSWDPAGVINTDYNVGYCWQTSFWTEEPIVITNLDIAMQTNSTVTGALEYGYGPLPYEWKWYNNAPYPITNGDFIEDMVVNVTVDSPYSQQVASETSIVIHKNNFSINSQIFSQTDLWETDDMLPANNAFSTSYYDRYFHGFWIEAKDVNVPIPAKSRVRINIVVPSYFDQLVAPHYADDNVWRLNDPSIARGYGRAIWSGTLTYLERKA